MFSGGWARLEWYQTSDSPDFHSAGIATKKKWKKKEAEKHQMGNFVDLWVLLHKTKSGKKRQQKKGSEIHEQSKEGYQGGKKLSADLILSASLWVEDSSRL